MIFIASIGCWIFKTTARAQQVPLSHGAKRENGAHIYAAHVMATWGTEGKKTGEKSCESRHLTHVIWKKG